MTDNTKNHGGQVAVIEQEGEIKFTIGTSANSGQVTITIHEYTEMKLGDKITAYKKGASGEMRMFAEGILKMCDYADGKGDAL